MFTLSFLATFLCFLVGLALLEELLLFFMFRPWQKARSENLPRISILLAVRDEEENIDRCLAALQSLDYPPELMEILIGDDESSDKSWEIIRRYEENDNRVRAYRITKEVGLARGKANVLAQLIPHATSDLFLITDADVAVSAGWARHMATNVKKSVGIVNGLTAVKGSTSQHMEWIQAQGMMHVLQQFVPVTAIGNNMMVTRRAYLASGGFENISFSVTEDFALAQKVLEKNFRIQSRLCRGTHATTRAEKSLGGLLAQRKRWMQGAMRLPVGIVLLLLVRALYYPAVLALMFIFMEAAIIIVVMKSVLTGIFINRVNRQTSTRIPWHAFIWFEPYLCIMSWLEILVYLMPGKVRWKGRIFQNEL